jgi:protein pelota
MKILKIDKKENYVQIIPESFDDLWHIEKIIEKGDKVSGETERKIKPKNEGEKTFKQKIFVEIEAEKPEFHETTGELRILGKVISAKPEESVPHGMAHTIEAKPGTKISIKKNKLKEYHIQRLEKAKETTTKQKPIIILLDDEEAEIATFKDIGIEIKAKIKNTEKQGKMFKTEDKTKYFEEISEKINAIKPNSIIIAGQSFQIQKLEKYLKEKNYKGQIYAEPLNSTGQTGFNELIKNGKMDKLLEGIQSAEEIKALERLMKAISKEMAAIGQKETLNALEKGAASELMISEKFMIEKREEANQMLEIAEQTKTKIQFFSPKSQPGKTIEGLGGTAAILRYKEKY